MVSSYRRLRGSLASTVVGKDYSYWKWCSG